MKRIEKYLSRYANTQGKIFLVTGANSGLGYAATEHFVSLHHTVIMACRNVNKGSEAKEALLQKYPQAKLFVYAYDQADFESMNACVNDISRDFPHIDGFILNAGIYHPRQGLKTKQDFPLTMGTNYLGVYYFLRKCLEKGLFVDTYEQRIVFVGSLSWYRVKIKKIEAILTTFAGDNTAQYCRSKTAIGTLAYTLHQREVIHDLTLPKTVKATLMHPGITSTNIVGSMSSSFPAWFSYLAHKALYVFTHHPRIASLGIVDLALNTAVDESKILVPRGLFHLSGYPKKMNYPKNLKENMTALLTTTEEVLAKYLQEK